MRCRVCGHAIRWVARRSAWIHARRGSDHAPMPEKVA